MSASRQGQPSHVSHDNFTQRPNPFQHYLQGLGNFTSLASASPMLSMLTRPHRPPDETPTLSPSPSSHPRPYHPYTRRVPSQHAPDTTYPYACVVPFRHASDTAYLPYARGVPSQHAPYTHGVPSRHHSSLRFCILSVV
ncbi:hypothetical protein O181_130146 [Austropuccinia psidii MF-1]|uniref:Uncharacterized protein n=1 Tax=Austropuccinia psidii MF-1 TaxID=1389203 RepID=A0A9Q3L1I0_9BASI|nr:hypothetical protein [Austropuccinia psidii MF-1]